MGQSESKLMLREQLHQLTSSNDSIRYILNKLYTKSDDVAFEDLRECWPQDPLSIEGQLEIVKICSQLLRDGNDSSSSLSLIRVLTIVIPQLYSQKQVIDDAQLPCLIMNKLQGIHIWAQGIGQQAEIEVDNHVDLMRLLLVCCSSQMFESPSDFVQQLVYSHSTSQGNPLNSAQSPPVSPGVGLQVGEVPQQVEAGSVLRLLCSLLNVAIDAAEQLSSQSWMTSAAVKLEYQEMFKFSIELLCVLLESGQTRQVQVSDNPHESFDKLDLSDLPLDTNLMVFFYSRLHREHDFQFLLDGAVRMLQSQIIISTYADEVVMFLFRLVQFNPKFKKVICKSPKSMDVLCGLLHILSVSKVSNATIAVMKNTSYLLHYLSMDREFGACLNATINGNPALTIHDVTVSQADSYADLLVLSVCSVASSVKDQLPILQSLLITMSNVSPFIKNVNAYACSRAISLLQFYCKPNVIALNDWNHLMVFYLLEICNNVVQYHACALMVYELLRIKKSIDGLQQLTFEQLQFGPLFKPNQEWFDSWKVHLPLAGIEQLYMYLLPQIETLQDGDYVESVLSFLQSVTLVGVLPHPPPVSVRPIDLERLRAWSLSYLWGFIYLRNTINSPSLWNNTDIKLFTIKYDAENEDDEEGE